MKVARDIGRFLQQKLPLLAQQVVVCGVWLLFLTVIEIFGRRSSSDFMDFLVIIVILAAFAVTIALKFPWLNEPLAHGYKAVGNFFSWWFSDRLVFGIDYRTHPPLPRKLPKFWSLSFLGMAVANVGAVVLCGYLPVYMRLWMHNKFYLGYLCLLAGLLYLIFLISVYLGLVACGGFHDYFVEMRMRSGNRSKDLELAVSISVLILCGCAAFVLPAWTPLVLFWLLMLVCSVSWLLYPDTFCLLWKRHGKEEVHAIAGHFANWLLFLALLMMASLLMLITRGHVLVSNEPFPSAMLIMPVTNSFGIFLTWISLLGMVSIAVMSHKSIKMRGFLCSARGSPLTLHFTGKTNWKLRKSLKRIAKVQGWRLRFEPRRSCRTDVCVHLVEEPVKERADSPLPVTLQSLANPEVIQRLIRRDEIQSRRFILRGLEKIFKFARRQRNRPGIGYWIGLQHWYLSGITRDEDGHHVEGEEKMVLDSCIGITFNTVIPEHARFHYKQITTALVVDLIFIEDGVSFRRFKRVLRQLFEVYDIHGGGRRVEEYDFTGFPGVRVILHEFSMGETWQQLKQGYPEPAYVSIGRARILHVFKDREESEEWEPLPAATDDVPLLSGSGY